MKKIIFYVMILVMLTFIIPTLFTITGKNIVEAKNNQLDKEIGRDKEIANQQYDYGNYNTIKLLHTNTNTIEEINLDEYLYGVVSSEMPADFELEALKAQAVVARTYTIYKMITDNQKHNNADICDNSACCQAWISKEDRLAKWEEEKRELNWNKIVTAVNETKGTIITYEGAPINAFFHSNSGGVTESPVNVWGGSRISIFTSS